MLLGVGVLGGIGAVGRFALDGVVSRRTGSRFPYGTLAVNLCGAFMLGVLVGAAVVGDTYRLVGVGLLGAFTTFSTLAFESHRLAEDGRPRIAVANVAVSLVLGLLLAFVGRELGGAL